VRLEKDSPEMPSGTVDMGKDNFKQKLSCGNKIFALMISEATNWLFIVSLAARTVSPHIPLTSRTLHYICMPIRRGKHAPFSNVTDLYVNFDPPDGFQS